MKTKREIRKLQINNDLHNSIWHVVDWFFPPNCPGCGVEGELICDSCQSKIVRLTGKNCVFCGQAVRGADICNDCRNRDHSYIAYKGYAFYTGVMRESILRLKYQNDIGIARLLSDFLENLVRTSGWDFDVIIPIPLSRQKLSERGYNQASRLAKPLAAKLGKLYCPNALIRIRETSSQVGLDIRSRLDNVENAFRANSKLIKNKTVLLIDDVFTTGATLESAASELKLSGAKAVYAMTLAKSSRIIKDFE